MKVYCVPDCKECDDIKDYLTKTNSDVEVVNLEKIEDKWMEKTEDGYIECGYKSFPTLYFGSQNERNYALVGGDGIESYLIKKFVHDLKTCPFTGRKCSEKQCEMFSILYNGLIPEGNCSLKWMSVLMTESIAAMKK